ncbi:MAG: DUF512 domain-containing protein [Thermoleophilia bacterium]
MIHSRPDSKIPAPVAKVTSVAAGSAAAAAGLLPGDIIVSLAGRPLLDVLDYQFGLDSGTQELEVERAGERLLLRLETDESTDPGIRFETALFDGIRRCSNRCLFCFIDQLPRGLRQTLYLKDDDYRLSFLHGNFITLNNLGAGDLARIGEQRLSPLHVSVHATSPVIRAHMMGCSRYAAASGLEAMKALGRAGIELHAQIVLCRGVNDGAVLKRTVAELAHEFPGMASVGIVPAALAEGFVRGAGTGHGRGGLMRPLTPEGLTKVVESVAEWQRRFRDERGRGFVYAADEFYLKAGLPLPALPDYDELPQYENGIGIAASFIEDLPQLGESLYSAGLPAGRVFLLSGELAAPLIEFACGKLTRATGGSFWPLVAANRLFGPHVTVTGLLGGADIAAAVRAAGLAEQDLLLLPAACLESSGERFLDDMGLDELRSALACAVRVI